MRNIQNTASVRVINNMNVAEPEPGFFWLTQESGIFTAFNTAFKADNNKF